MRTQESQETDGLTEMLLVCVSSLLTLQTGLLTKRSESSSAAAAALSMLYHAVCDAI